MAEPAAQEPPRQSWMDWLRGLGQADPGTRQAQGYASQAGVGAPPMRFDASGRTQPAVEKMGPGHPIGQNLLESVPGTSMPGGMVGGLVVLPRSASDIENLHELFATKTFGGTNQRVIKTPAEGEKLRAVRDLTKDLPREEIDLTQAQPIFTTKPSMFGHGGRRITQYVEVPGISERSAFQSDKIPFRTIDITPGAETSPGKVEWQQFEPFFRATDPREIPHLQNLFNQYVLDTFGKPLSGMTALPISGSRERLFRKQGWTGKDTMNWPNRLRAPRE